MTAMHFFKRLFRPRFHRAVVAWMWLACSFAVAADDPTHGAGYLTLAKPQPTEAAGKIEVLEFFSYHCPHCYALDPTLGGWLKKHKDDIVFKRVHVAWGEPGSTTEKMMSALQRAYYTLDAMGKGEEMHKKFFDAIHAERQPLYRDDAIIKFLVKQGIDPQKYDDTANSFTVQSRMQRARRMFAAYGLEGVPSLVVDGRFVTSPQLASRGGGATEQENGAAALRLMDILVAKAMVEHGTGAKNIAASTSKSTSK